MLAKCLISAKSRRENLWYKKSFDKIANEDLLLFPQPSLVEPAGKLSMLHPCMRSTFLINIENTESTHGEIL